MVRSIDVFHVGPQKSGTTWLYRCLREHPELRLAKRGSVHYLDIHYAEGPDWLARQFPQAGDGGLSVDMTDSYLRAPLAPERAQALNPQARIILCLRDPLERAFSHYWHEKKKSRFNYQFSECLENYDLFQSWVEPGFYATHAARWIAVFGREAVLMQEFSRLERDPAGFLAEAIGFMGLDSPFTPSVLHERFNVARPRRSRQVLSLRRRIAGTALAPVARRVLSAVRRVRGPAEGYRERLADVPPSVCAALRAIFAPEIAGLEDLLGRQLPALRGKA